MLANFRSGAAVLAAALAATAVPTSAAAQAGAVSVADGVHAGELAVPVNKSQVIRSDRAYSRALIGNPEVADVLPLTDRSLYVLGKKTGTTSLTLYDRANGLIAVMDVVVGPDVTGLKRQLSEVMPSDQIGARMSNDSIVLDGVVSSAAAADRAVQLAETYAPGKVVNMMSLGSAQQVMLEVRFSEVKRSALKQIGVGTFIQGGGNNGFAGAIGGGASLTPGAPTTINVGGVTTTVPGAPLLQLGSIVDSFGILSRTFRILGGNFEATLDALERKGAITTLAEPTLVSLSGETASFLAGGEFPVPVVQNSGGNGGGGNTGTFTVEWKPFGVSLAFTPTVLADGVINLVVAPEVSSIDPTASIVINNLRIPGLQTRRARTTVELRDGESFAMAGLLRQDFQSTVRQFPGLGSIPIIGALFRSNGFQKDETELVIIVTPRLVRPVRAGALKLPTDTAKQPNDADFFLNGRTDTGVPLVPGLSRGAPRAAPPPPPPPTTPVGAATGSAARGPIGLEKEYGHVL
ncbi:type II and III secretion system protein family protein [Sphingomonas sp. BN140010]|uniref:Type II and III secretion system protein family protein n=1 Tax=Sphingomonas arvum TaxID=2992113 RepID=A0ABT3JDK8_9SPHN|nr:type II and III secretion system protein family protein [Sphingomonas sp. BN140010]MCW3797175.1 type II and III secretion system protein family protein [Sphingomonas sp. BN140010]